MPRKPRLYVVAPAAQLSFAIPAPGKLDPLLGVLTHRLDRWSDFWRETWNRVQRGERVSRFHRGMMRATLERLAGRGPREENSDE